MQDASGMISVVTCTDPRFNVSVIVQLEKLFGQRAFSHTPAGSVKEIIEYGGNLRKHNPLSKQYDFGVRKHVFVAHQDCAAYGGSGAWKSFKEERQHQIGELRAARLKFLDIYPDVEIFLYFAHLDTTTDEFSFLEEIPPE